MKRIVLGVAAVAVGTVGTSKGAVYIAPPDIDQYKQKTDQSFYDLYQNNNSALRVNPNAKRYLNNLSTDQRVLEGYVLPSIRGVFVQGTHITPSAKTFISIGNTVFRIEVGERGVLMVRTRVPSSAVKVRTGEGFAETTQVLKKRCTSGGKYGCTQLTYTKRDIYLNAISGEYMVRDYETRQGRSCGKWGCSRWSAEQFVRLVNVQKGTIPVAEYLKTGKKHRVNIDGVVSIYDARHSFQRVIRKRHPTPPAKR